MVAYYLRKEADAFEAEESFVVDGQKELTITLPLDAMRKAWEELQKEKDAAFLRKMRHDSEAPSRLNFNGSSFVLEIDGGKIADRIATLKGKPAKIAAQMLEAPQPLNLELLAIIAGILGEGAHAIELITYYKQVVAELGNPKP